MKPSTVAETYNELMGPESQVKFVEIQVMVLDKLSMLTCIENRFNA